MEINKIINALRHNPRIGGHLCAHYRFAVDKLYCQTTWLV